jgi:hypothetical protein
MRELLLLLLLHFQSLILLMIFITVSASSASNPSLAPVYSSMATFSPRIQMGSGEEDRFDAHKKLLIGLIISFSSLGLIILFCFGFWVYRKNQSPKSINNSGTFISNERICNKFQSLYVFNGSSSFLIVL